MTYLNLSAQAFHGNIALYYLAFSPWGKQGLGIVAKVPEKQRPCMERDEKTYSPGTAGFRGNSRGNKMTDSHSGISRYHKNEADVARTENRHAIQQATEKGG